MEIILLERIARLGQMGDIVTVKDGFARNFLLPQAKALRATTSNKARFETERAQLEAANLKARDEAESVASSMKGLKVIMIRSAGESGQLYGSVSSRDIADAVTEAGVTIKRTQVNLDRAIKTLGLHEVLIKLHPEVSETVKVNIARSSEEADTQFETGSAVVEDHEFTPDFESGFDPEDGDEASAENSDSEDAEATKDSDEKEAVEA